MTGEEGSMSFSCSHLQKIMVESFPVDTRYCCDFHIEGQNCSVPTSAPARWPSSRVIGRPVCRYQVYITCEGLSQQCQYDENQTNPID